ncbi:YqgE/AlgH family protein [Hufsiella ginkgonis]|uniref:YqgE/AlgH family protein n=1 Tax=Hufsiella ginkgonis TaxID=2695274 RepID=A0A7K1XWS3_9SPHI|nr:YqgE/AlgH family protein [Hufsiella ginkgonis]MXV15452.1 YqgE/AlgH family protein [Hufsiella ginkgonis]
MLNPTTPRTSGLLVSEPFMLDPNFKRSVVLLTEHDENGTVGYVLNQRSNLLLRDILEECPEADHAVFVGGPVGGDSLHFIHRCYDRMNSGEEIGNGIYWGGNFETLKLLVNSGQVEPHEIKFFMGYSGWGVAQLDQEIGQNSWLVTNHYNNDIVFLDDEENLWKEVVIGLGPRYAHIAKFPENPMWN